MIDVTLSTTVSNGNSVNPVSIATGDLGINCSFAGEAYESMLIKVNNITFEGMDEYDNWIINDGSGQALVDDYFFDGIWPSVSPNDYFESITGLVQYSYSEFKILPRNDDDFDHCLIGDPNGDGSTIYWTLLPLQTVFLEKTVPSLKMTVLLI